MGPYGCSRFMAGGTALAAAPGSRLAATDGEVPDVELTAGESLPSLLQPGGVEVIGQWEDLAFLVLRLEPRKCEDIEPFARPESVDVRGAIAEHRVEQLLR